MSEKSEDTVGVMIRPPKKVVAFYQKRAGELTSKGQPTTHNRLMVADLERIMESETKNPQGRQK